MVKDVTEARKRFREGATYAYAYSTMYSCRDPELIDTLLSTERECSFCGRALVVGQKFCGACKELAMREIQQSFNIYKHLRGCDICGYNQCPGALVWHHVLPRSYAILIQRWFFGDSEEIEKCVLLCSNCHREVHDGYTICNITPLSREDRFIECNTGLIR